VEEETYKQNYITLKELLNNIRYTGTRGNGVGKKGFWIPKVMDELEEAYKKRFKSIVATHQVFYCRGVK